MQPPPPFEMPGGPPRKKSALPWIIVGGVLVCCVGPIAAIGIGGLSVFNNVKPIAECTVAMGGLSSALRDYSQDHGGKLPPAATWQKEIAPYYDKMLKNEDAGPFKIPKSGEPFGCGSGADRTPFAFNTVYGGKKVADIKDPDMAILVFETTGAPAMNRAEAYKDPGKAASPKIYGQPRGWFALNARFEPVTIEDGRQKAMGSGMRRTGGGSN